MQIDQTRYQLSVASRVPVVVRAERAAKRPTERNPPLRVHAVKIDRYVASASHIFLCIQNGCEPTRIGKLRACII